MLLSGKRLSLVLLAMVLRLHAQSATPRLTDGEPFSIRGKLQVIYRGWHRYLVLPLAKPYVAEFGAGEGTKRVSALELNPGANFAEVARSDGQIIEAKGKLQLEGVSPYYWNGVMLMADTTRLPNGAIVAPTRATPVVSLNTQLYMVTITMTPHRYEWQRQAVDLTTNRPLPEADVDGCGLNGGGDVMTCGCVDGFQPLRAAPVVRAFGADLWQHIPKAEGANAVPGQFDLPDPDATKPQIVQVVCKRNKAQS